MERRFIGDEVRSGDNGRIEGYAAVFYDGTPQTEYRLAEGVVERIYPTAFDEPALAEDIVGLFNHADDNLLGRTSSKTLRVSVDRRGLRYEIDPGATTIASDVREHIRRGDVNGSSFAFSVPQGGDSWTRDGETRVRELRALQVWDVGPVVNPAYSGTSTAARSALGDVSDVLAQAPQEYGSELEWPLNLPSPNTTTRVRRIVAGTQGRSKRGLTPTADRVRRLKCGAALMGKWCVLPEFLEAMALAYRAGALRVGLERRSDDRPRNKGYDVRGGIAVISIEDHMTKRETSFGGTSSAEKKKAIRAAAKDPAAGGIMLRIDSPGGTVAGTDALAAEVVAARRRKPVAAHFDGIGASAAYWVGSQASHVSASRTTAVGSIGTVAVVHDQSGAYDKAGIHVHVISTGARKGDFVSGAPVDRDALDALQAEVSELNRHFIRAVKIGRRRPMDDVMSWATGETWLAARAKDRGLIDDVMDFDAAMDHLASLASERAEV